MNHSFMQKLQAQKNQGGNLGLSEALLNDSPGLRLGKGMNIDPAHAGLTPAAEALAKAPGQLDKPEKFEQASSRAPESLGATFANEVLRRMGETDGEERDSGQLNDSNDLRHSLGQTMDWMRKRFGDETAAAAAGMVLQSTANGVTEETLGEGLLNAVKFIDRNFGIAAGDAVMANFNSGINTELNEYFDNGKSELFFAADSPPDVSATSPTQDLTARVFMRAVNADKAEDKDAESLTEQLLADLAAELDKIAELQDLTTQLEAEFNPVKATPEAAIAAYEAAPTFSEPQFTSIAV